MIIDENNTDKKMKIDKSLLLRLFGYTKGYQKYILLSLFLLIFVIGIELLRPYLVGKAIDEVIGNYSREITDVVDGEEKISFLVYPEGSSNYFLFDHISKKVSDDFKLGYSIVSVDDKALVIQIKENTYELPVQSSQEIKAFRKNDFKRLWQLTMIFVGMTLFGVVVNYFQMLLLHYTGQKIVYKIRNEVFTHIQGLSVQYFNNQPVGKIVTRITNDTETLNEMYTSVIVDSVKSVIMLIGIVITMLFLNIQLTLYVMIVVPFILLSAFLFRRYSKRIYNDVRTYVAAINTFLSEHISGMKVVQIFAKEKESLRKFDINNKKLLKSNMSQLILFSIFRPFMYLAFVVATGITLYAGSHLVMNRVITLGVLIMFLQYVSSFFDPIQQLAEQFDIFQSAVAAAEKIFSVLDDTQAIENNEGDIQLDSIQGKIEFKHVWFAYDSENWVLKDVSFIVNPGETVAFVGATGAGKTSILNLITRYYQVQKGEILIDDHPINSINKYSLRKYVGQMMQDVFVFTGDIESNIRLKEEDITQEDIIRAAQYVHADTFIEKLPDKYQEHTFEKGVTYSTGQRQLLSFARTLAYEPKILVLDEATSNIDTETELLIQDALKRIMEGRTTLVVAHRLSTIQHADQIIVLHKGRIKEIGNHQQLLAKEGFYYSLYRLQFKEEELVANEF